MKTHLGGTQIINSTGSHLFFWHSRGMYRLYLLDESIKLIKNHSLPNFILGWGILHDNAKLIFLESAFGIQNYNLETDQFLNIFDGLKG